jgi:hypothetical protein
MKLLSDAIDDQMAESVCRSKTPATVGLVMSVLRDLTTEISKAMRERSDLIRELRAEVDELKRGMSYEGAWTTAKAYHKHQFVTHNGSMWSARCATTQKPGDGNDWQLSVKGTR